MVDMKRPIQELIIFSSSNSNILDGKSVIAKIAICELSLSIVCLFLEILCCIDTRITLEISFHLCTFES